MRPAHIHSNALRCRKARYDHGMGLLDTLAMAFINTFGITQPTDATRRRASWFILGMLILTLLVVAVGGYVLYMNLRSGAGH